MFSNVLLNFIPADVLSASLFHNIKYRYGSTILDTNLRSLLGAAERYEYVFGEGYFFWTVIVQYC